MATRAPQERVVALGPSSVSSVVSRSGGTLRVTVIAKATFALAPDAEMPCTEPLPIVDADLHHANNPMRTVRVSSDRVPYLGQGEAFFVGHAHAPEGALVESTTVRFAVFDESRPLIDRTLKIRKSGGFKKIALVYENAFGGIGCQDNPFGAGAIAGSEQPSVLDPADEKRPACFGPIGAVWPSRRRKLGAVKRSSLEAPIAEIPEGFDWSYFQAAPEEQRTRFFHGNEWIVLEGLQRGRPVLRTRLPGARGFARVYGLGPFGVAEGQPLILHADTLHVDGDDQRCTLTFRGIFPVASEEALDALMVVAGIEIAGAPLLWPASVSFDASPSSRTPERPGKVSLSREQTPIPLDDESIEIVESQGFGGTLVLDDPPDDDDDDDGATGTIKGFLPAFVKPVLPFAGKVSALAQPAAPASSPSPSTGTVVHENDDDDDDDGGRTINASIPLAEVLRAGALPFGQAPRASAAVPVAPPMIAPPVIAPPVIAPPVIAPPAIEPPAVASPPAIVPAPPLAKPAPAKPAPAKPEADVSPWAPAPAAAPAPAPRRAPAPAPVPPTATPALKKGLYGRFGR